MAPLGDLKHLAKASGGLYFYVSDHSGVQGLLGALKEALKLAESQVWKYVTIQLCSANQSDQWLATMVPISWFPLHHHSLSHEKRSTFLHDSSMSKVMVEDIDVQDVLFFNLSTTYLWTTVTNQNYIHNKIMSRLNLGNSCFHAIQNLLSSSLLSKNEMIKYTTMCNVTCFVWVWNVISHIKGRTEVESVCMGTANAIVLKPDLKFYSFIDHSEF
jgi:hypothetical protein